MNERDLARLLATIEQARPALAEAERVAADVMPIVVEAQRIAADAMPIVAEAQRFADVMPTVAEAQRIAADAMPIAAEAQRVAADAMPIVTIVDRLRQWWEAIKASSGHTVEQLQAAFFAVKDRLRLDAQTIASAVGFVVAKIVERAHYLYEISTERLAGRLRSRSNRRLDAAAYFLESADRTVSELPLVDEADGSDVESYEAVSAMHNAVGALEEVVCHVARTPTSTLPRALKKLVRRGVITEEQAAPMNRLYLLRRNGTRGVGHGADAAPNVIARSVIWQVREGIFVLLNAAGIGTVPSTQGTGRLSMDRLALSAGRP